MQRPLKNLLLIGLLSSTITCREATTEPPQNGFCLAVTPGPALLLTVINIQSGEAIADGVTATWSTFGASGSFQLAGMDIPLFVGGLNGGGVYTVTVSKSGLQTWTGEGLVVKQGQCGPLAVNLAARMSFLPDMKGVPVR